MIDGYVVELEVEMYVRVFVRARSPEEAMDRAQELVQIQEYEDSVGVALEREDEEAGERVVDVYAGAFSSERWEVSDGDE